MSTRQIIYIIPGYGSTRANDSDYGKVAEIFEKKGFEVVHVSVGWGKKKLERFSDYSKGFLKKYKRPKGARVYVLGFSFGATVALLAASKAKPDKLVLCSLSPFFTEDLDGNEDKSWVKWFRKNFKESDYSFKELAKSVTCDTHLILGSKEDKECKTRAREAKKALQRASLTVAKGAGHNLGNRKYLQAVEKVARKM